MDACLSPVPDMASTIDQATLSLTSKLHHYRQG